MTDTPTPDEMGIDPGANPWGVAACEFMRRIARVGEAQALADEAEAIDTGTPIWNHDDWKAYILSRILGQDPPRPTVGLSSETYECPRCQDRAYICESRGGIVTARACTDCQAGRSADRGNTTAKDKAEVDAWKADKRNQAERRKYRDAAERIRRGHNPGSVTVSDEDLF